MTVDKSVEERKKYTLGGTVILSYKLCINILLEPVKIDIKRTQTKNKTVRKNLNDKIQFCLPCGRWVNGCISFIYNYIRNRKFRISTLEHFF